MIDRFFIKDSNYIDLDYVQGIYEFAKLKECEQNPKWHSEGNAWEHTVKCLRSAYDHIEDEMYDGLDPRIAILSVLFHDIGKCRTTSFRKGNWHAYGHEFESERIARRILWNDPIEAREIVCECARYHMKVLNLSNSKNIVTDMVNMSRIPFATWKYLLFVKHCDILGSFPKDALQTIQDRKTLLSIYDIANSLGVLDGKFRLKTSSANDMVFRPICPECSSKCLPTVYVLIGLPGAGKNTYVDKFIAKNDVKVVSRDDIREELGYCEKGCKAVLSREKEDEVTKIFNERVISFLEAGNDVCLNNLNIKKKYRDEYKSLLKKYPVNWEYIYVEAPGIEHNIECRDTFPEGIILSMTETLDWPQPDEYDELLIEKWKKS